MGGFPVATAARFTRGKQPLGATWFDPQLFFVYLVGIGGSVLGLAGLLSGRSWPVRRRAGVCTLFALGLVVLGVVAAAVGQPTATWLPPVFLAGLCVAFPLLQSSLWERSWAGVRSFLRDPRGQGCVLILASLLASFAWMCRVEEQAGGAGMNGFSALPAEENGLLEAVVPSPAHTDRGQTVPVFRAAGDTGFPVLARQREAELLGGNRLTEQVIRTADIDPTSNCHGWTFAAGRYVIPTDQVPLILEQNGYQVVAPPRPDDLVLYFDADGRVIHSGVVRTAGADVPVLVESKWGLLGRFLHHATLPIYARHSWLYYRSPRAGHLLRGLDGDRPSPIGKTLPHGSLS